MKKFLSLALALMMLLSLVACGGNNNTPANDNPGDVTNNDTPDTPSDTPAEPGAFQPVSYDDETVYMNALSDFYAKIQEAQACTDKDELYAKLAIAEAKLLEAAVVVPYYSDGGSYGVTHVVPGSVPSVMWGSDIDRFYTAIVATDLLKVEDRLALKAMWNELKGTGTYEESAKAYLAEHGYTTTNEYVYAYSSDPEVWDPLAAWTNTVGEPMSNVLEGLAHYDMENVIQPALAESWDVSDDGLTWTFHLRPGQIWVDSQGRKLDDIKADDWIASAQHLFDNYGDSAAEVLAPMVVNGYEYSIGDISDFSQVGVEAVDDLTLVYHLTAPAPTFDTMLTYCGFFAPLCRSYYEAQGGTFGQDHTSGSFGSDPDHIAYCGTYLIKGWTKENSIVFEENPSYYNAGNINITKLTFKYYDGSDPLATYNDTVAGSLTSAGLGTSALKKCQEDGIFEEYGNYVSSLTGTTRQSLYCLNRQIFHNYNDETACVSPQAHDSTDTLDKDNDVSVADASIVDDAARTHAAMNNLDFRMALARGWDQASYHAQYVGEENKLTGLRNTYTPGTFISLESDVTVSINGTSTTFPAGTYYGEMVQAQITADGYTMKVWDPNGDDGNGSGDGYDGWYDMDKAREHMAAAVEALGAIGVEVSKENPIQIDYIYYSPSESMTNRAQAYKQSIDLSLEGLVQVNLVATEDSSALNNATFYNPDGATNNSDMVIGQAWSADYGDPSSYLLTLAPYGDGYMTKSLGVW